jgi:DNA replication protein DnaC
MFETFQQLMDSMGKCGACGSDLDWRYTPREQQELLEAHNRMGEALSAVIRGTQPLCSGCERLGDERRRDLVRKRRVKARIDEAYQTGAMPEEAREWTLLASKLSVEERNEDAWIWAHRWSIKSPNAWVMGEEGTGKTFLMRCILNLALEFEHTACEVKAFDLNRLADRYDADPLIKRWGNADVLGIEDIDKVDWSVKGYECLWHVIDVRCSGRRRTVITSNVNPEHMQAKWKALSPDNPSRVSTLFARLIPTERLVLTGPSLRKQMQAELAGMEKIA